MKCKGCGEEFPHLSALTKHKPDCPGLKDSEVEPEQIFADSGPACIIPIDICPEEIKLFAQGQTIGLRVEGALTTEGIVVQEVKFIR